MHIEAQDWVRLDLIAEALIAEALIAEALIAEALTMEALTTKALRLRHHKSSLTNTSNRHLNGNNGRQSTGQYHQMLQHRLTLQNLVMLPYHFILPRLTRRLQSTATIDIFMEAREYIPKSIHNVADLHAAARLITEINHEQRTTSDGPSPRIRPRKSDPQAW